MSALDVQVGGDHYKDRKIQPVEYIHANNLDFFQGNVVKYVTRWRDKNGIPDLEKCIHYLQLYIELENKAAAFVPLDSEEELLLHEKHWTPAEILKRRAKAELGDHP